MSERPVVMVVEDDVEMNDLEREFLDINGLDSVAAYTGREALDLWRLQKADAVLLDIMLPEMDGFETCKRLRRADDDGRPIIIVTALDSEDCRRKGYEVGASAFFSKPFDPNEIVSTLRTMIDANRSLGANRPISIR